VATRSIDALPVTWFMDKTMSLSTIGKGGLPLGL
jgi:hypothetical protein